MTIEEIQNLLERALLAHQYRYSFAHLGQWISALESEVGELSNKDSTPLYLADLAKAWLQGVRTVSPAAQSHKDQPKVAVPQPSDDQRANLIDWTEPEIGTEELYEEELNSDLTNQEQSEELEEIAQIEEPVVSEEPKSKKSRRRTKPY